MTVQTGGTSAGLVGRVTGMILRPRDEWQVVDAEVTTTQGLFTGYVMILAAIPAVLTLVITLFLGSMLGALGGMMGIAVGLSPIFAVIKAVLSYVVSLVMVYVLGLLINAFAPSFGAVPDKGQAMKVAAYAPTAVWVSCLALIIPFLGVLVVLAAAIYTIFVFHWGLRAVMKAPEDKGPGYTAVVIIVGCVVAFVINLVIMAPIGLMTARSMFGSVSHPNVTIKLPNGAGSVNVNEATAAVNAMAEQMKAAQNGTAPAATDPATLQAMLPARLPGFTRSETSSAAAGMGMMNGSQASGVYEKGDSKIKLSVTDLGVAGAMASMVKVNSSHESATGYEKVTSAGGRTTTEEFHKDSNSGKYGVIVGSRYAVEAEGTRVSMDDMKNAVAAIPAARLEAMAKG
jgi:hypothetical protein